MYAETIISTLILIGAGFVLVGSIGLARLPDFFARLHGPTKATTLGLGAIVLAAVVHSATLGDGLSLKTLTVSLFLFITAPVSAHILAKAALKQLGRAHDTRPDA